MKIVIAAGGTSPERDVSLVTGRMVYRALKARGHKCILLDVFYGYNAMDADEPESLFDAKRDWAADIAEITEKDPNIEMIRQQRPDQSNAYFGPNVLNICKHADIVFLALHGGDGENGKVQAAFDLYDIKYTGTGYMSSALAMDKFYTKLVLKANSLPTPDYVLVHSGTGGDPVMAFPCVVKTRSGGSSVGVFIAEDEKQYKAALKEAFKYGSDVLVEKCIKGHEYSIGVIDGEALPIVDIAPKSGFYDYKNKYQDGSTIETCPAELPKELTEKMQECAVEVYRALEIKSYARMDFMMDKNNNFYCLEANTLPGMTATSLVPREAAAMGISFEELCDKLIQVSLKKYE